MDYDKLLYTTLADASRLGEPQYRADALISNEQCFNEVIERTSPFLETSSDSAYLGVGACQSYTYIANYRPSHAIIVDARVENLILHLVYKMLFSNCPSPFAFLCELFSRYPSHQFSLTLKTILYHIFSPTSLRVAQTRPSYGERNNKSRTDYICVGLS